jgi:hypothetical protein
MIQSVLVKSSFDSVSEAVAHLKAGADVAVVRTKVNRAELHSRIQKELKNLCGWWNVRTKPEYNIPEPNLDMILNPKKYQKEWRLWKSLPGLTGGMLHVYDTSVHDLFLQDTNIDELFTMVTGTPDYKLDNNRMRVVIGSSDNGKNTIHIEGENVLGGFGVEFIVALSNDRSFTYYEGTSENKHCQELFKAGGGLSSHFVMVKPEDMKGFKRKTVTFNSGDILLFKDNLAHEVCKKSPSVSLFLSPYDPDKYLTTKKRQLEEYSKCDIPEAKRRQKTNGGLPLPVSHRTPGQIRQHPSEFSQMLHSDTRIFGSLFLIGGAQWPSSKWTFFLMHMMSYNVHKKKFLPFMFDEHGRFRYEVITPKLLEKHPTYKDHLESYWKKHCPLYEASEEEISTCLAHLDNIPERAKKWARYWLKDVRNYPTTLAIKRNFKRKRVTIKSLPKD